jgi:hypothetical protein
VSAAGERDRGGAHGEVRSKWMGSTRGSATRDRGPYPLAPLPRLFVRRDDDRGDALYRVVERGEEAVLPVLELRAVERLCS